MSKEISCGGMKSTTCGRVVALPKGSHKAKPFELIIECGRCGRALDASGGLCFTLSGKPVLLVEPHNNCKPIEEE